MALDNNDRLSSFSTAIQRMIGITNNGYRDTYSETIHVYTLNEVEEIIKNGTVNDKITLSRSFFALDGIYKQLIVSMASLLRFYGITIPRSTNRNYKTDKTISKKYQKALGFIDAIHLKELSHYLMLRVLVDGAYYGLIVSVTKNSFGIIDLPAKFCRSVATTSTHRDIIEIDLSYFTNAASADLVKRYPKYVQQAYNKYMNGKGPQFFALPVESTIYLDLFGPTPLFLTSIPSIMQYNKGVETELTKEEQETRKILVQHMPHLSDGRLVFEPPEAEEMHNGAVNMLKNNVNLSVLTTYGETEMLNSKTTNDNSYNALEKLSQNIYVKSGVSGQLFAPTGSNALGTSLKNNISIMMTVAQKIEVIITEALNYLFGDNNLTFSFQFLPVSIHNEKELVDEYFKLASSGYSYLYPAAAIGLDARDFVCLKDVENDMLDLNTLMRPLNSAYTQSGSTGQVGRPRKEESEKAEQTIKNEQSQDNH